MSYTVLAHVSTGELATAALHNTLLDNVAYHQGLVAAALVGLPIVWPGSDAGALMGTTYGSGNTQATRASGTGFAVFDPAIVPGTFKWEATLWAESGATATLALFEASAPDTKLVGSEITSTSADGARVQSGSITLPAGGSNKTFFVKGHSNHASKQAWGIGIRAYCAS